MTIGDHVLVLGLGVSGRAATRLLLRKGSRVTAVDGNSNATLESAAHELDAIGATVELGMRDLPPRAFDACIVSPGIPLASNWLHDLSSRNVPVISELELGWMHRTCPVIAVTGSNGKSTCVNLCRDALEYGGLRAAAAGNIGVPISQVVLDAPGMDWLVVEVSSFQLESVRQFRPDIAVLLNIFPNHLDRHGSLESYREAKRRLFARLQDSDVALVHEDWLEAMRVPGIDCAWRSFGLQARSDYWFGDHHLHHRDDATIDLSNTPLDNPVLGAAAAAVAGVLDAAGVNPAAMRPVADAFVPLAHRMRKIRRLNGVDFVDDSKATNLAALQAAIELSTRPIRLIAGGRLKEKDLSRPKKVLARKVSGAYLIGEATSALAAAWHDAVSCRKCGTLEAAVSAAWSDSRPGDTILLSPACSSFDQFSSFVERGDAFAECVEQL